MSKSNAEITSELLQAMYAHNASHHQKIGRTEMSSSEILTPAQVIDDFTTLYNGISHKFD